MEPVQPSSGKGKTLIPAVQDENKSLLTPLFVSTVSSANTQAQIDPEMKVIKNESHEEKILLMKMAIKNGIQVGIDYSKSMHLLDKEFIQGHLLKCLGYFFSRNVTPEFPECLVNPQTVMQCILIGFKYDYPQINPSLLLKQCDAVIRKTLTSLDDKEYNEQTISLVNTLEKIECSSPWKTALINPFIEYIPSKIRRSHTSQLLLIIENFSLKYPIDNTFISKDSVAVCLNYGLKNGDTSLINLCLAFINSAFGTCFYLKKWGGGPLLVLNLRKNDEQTSECFKCLQGLSYNFIEIPANDINLTSGLFAHFGKFNFILNLDNSSLSIEQLTEIFKICVNIKHVTITGTEAVQKYVPYLPSEKRLETLKIINSTCLPKFPLTCSEHVHIENCNLAVFPDFELAVNNGVLYFEKSTLNTPEAAIQYVRLRFFGLNCDSSMTGIHTVIIQEALQGLDAKTIQDNIVNIRKVAVSVPGLRELLSLSKEKLPPYNWDDILNHISIKLQRQ